MSYESGMQLQQDAFSQKLASDIEFRANEKLAALANPTGGKPSGGGSVKPPPKNPPMTQPINPLIPASGTQQALGIQPIAPLTQSGAPTPPTTAK